MIAHPLHRTALLALACAIALPGAGSATPTQARAATSPQASVAATADPRWAELERARWIADGRDDAPRKVYVFTDPNCPYCSKVWADARPWVQGGKVQLRHLMVGILTPSSRGKAAAILGARDPAAKLAAYEGALTGDVAAMLATGKARPLEDARLLPLSPIPASVQGNLAGNQRLMASFGIRATPGIVSIGADGQVQARQGLAPQDLAAVMGPR